MGRRGALPYLVLAIAVVAVSHGAIFVRLAAAPPIAVAAWRTLLASLVVVPAAALLGKARPDARLLDWCLAIIAGGLLALHFAFWITSLSYTSIANSVLLVNTAPVWVALFALLIGRDLPGRWQWLAIGLSLAGAGIIASGSVGAGQGGWLGDTLAVGGAVAMAGYMLLARAAQRGLPFLPYVATAYGSAAAVLWIAVALTDVQWHGFTSKTWLALGALALVSQLIGHSGYNWSLRHLRTPMVAVALLGEPVLASILGWLVFGEALTPRTLAGGVLVLGAIALAVWAEQRPRAADGAAA
jgi:drug/metabolite transporter (DMT)-like permease